MSLIYTATNKINGMCYVGQTMQTLKERESQHYSTAFNGREKYIKFHQALVEYGRGNFTWDKILYCEKKEADRYEKALIKILNSKDPEGYNCDNGGIMNRGFLHYEETKEKISKALKGRSLYWLKGKPLSVEHKSKLSLALIGNENYKKNAGLYGNQCAKGNRFKLTEEQKIAISIRQTERWAEVRRLKEMGG